MRSRFRFIVSHLLAVLLGSVVATGIIYWYWVQINQPTSRPPATYTPAITLADVNDIPTLRHTIVNYIFGGDLPSTLPELDDDHLVVEMENGFDSNITLRQPDIVQFADALVIYHAGHESSQEDRNRQVVERLLDAGYIVAVMDMPLSTSK